MRAKGGGPGGHAPAITASRTQDKADQARVEPPTSRSLDVTELGEKLGYLVLRVEVVRAFAAHLVSKIAVPVVSVRRMAKKSSQQ